MSTTTISNSVMNALLLSIFQILDQNRIVYCLLRDGDALDQLPAHGEVDMLVQGNQIGQVQKFLEQFGFARLSNWGYRPHNFFLTYDGAAGTWLKLDIVTEIAYGRPSHALRTTLADLCLQRRRRCGPTFIPAPEDEFITLLLHCVLDKGRFAESRRLRLQLLRHQITDEEYLSDLLVAYWSPETTWVQIAALIDAEDWGAILAQRPTVLDYLSSRDRFGTLGRQARDRLLRKINRWAGSWRSQPPKVALLAPDGAGKSTLAAGVQQSFYFPVRSVYMGLYQKKQASSGRARLPGIGLARKIVTQWGRYLSARYHQLRGRLVLFDRYTYDAMLPPPRPGGRSVQVRRWLLAHACPAPELVIVLDAPGEILYARKGEHTPAVLEEQRQKYLQLRSLLPSMAVVDATQSAETVRREVIQVIWRGYTGQRGVG